MLTFSNVPQAPFIFLFLFFLQTVYHWPEALQAVQAGQRAPDIPGSLFTPGITSLCHHTWLSLWILGLVLSHCVWEAGEPFTD